jgi:hypothetical protein
MTGAEVLAPGRSAFADGQMPWGDVAFDVGDSRTKPDARQD